jgi:hypothetical protein
VAKNKKKKKDKKASAAKTASGLKALAQSPLAADVVAAALVATAAALKDSRRARALASDVGEELTKLSKTGAQRGEALWDMALQIGRRSLEAALGGDEAPKRAKSASKPKVARKTASKPKPKSTAKKASKKKPAGASKR